MPDGLRAEEAELPGYGTSLRLSEMDVLGRLGAVVSPVVGTADFRLRLAQQRAQSLKGEPLSPTTCGNTIGFQEAYVHKADIARSAKIVLEGKEQRLVSMLNQMDSRCHEKASRSVLNFMTQQEAEVRKARIQLIDAEESRNLGELALQYNSLQGEDGAQNGQQSFLSAVRASALARTRNIEDGARAIEQIRRAKAEIVAARERDKQEETERVQPLKRLERPNSSPALGQNQLPLLRSSQQNYASVLRPIFGSPSSAPVTAVREDEEAKQKRERWIQYVRAQYHKDLPGQRKQSRRSGSQMS